MHFLIPRYISVDNTTRLQNG